MRNSFERGALHRFAVGCAAVLRLLCACEQPARVFPVGECRVVLDDRAHRLLRNELGQPADRDFLLLVIPDEGAQVGGELGREPEEVREEREVAHGEAAPRHAPARHQQHHAGADDHGDAVDGVDKGVEHLRLHCGLLALGVQLLEVAHRVALRFAPCDLQRLDRAEHLGQEPCDPIARLAFELVIVQHPAPGRPAHRVCDGDGHERHQRDLPVDGRHDRHRGNERNEIARYVRQPGREVTHLADVVLIPVDCLAGRDAVRQGAGPAQECGEQVASHQRAGRVAKRPARERLPVGREDACHADADIRGNQGP